ncbi:MAG: hypothetical protein O7C98_00845, partial [Planctomycetota bacterium]|nr:hypothetical protein [Planctomycetota bacterium]
AGGSPETTVVVVNADSPLSRWVANEYVRLRHIPPGHVIELRQIQPGGIIDVDAFRSGIWTPIQTYLKQSGLAEHVDTIAYSADFPYGVDFKADVSGKRLTPPVASLTGATYFAQRVMDRDTKYVDDDGNAQRANLYWPRKSGRKKLRKYTVEETEQWTDASQALQRGDFQTALDLFDKLVTSFPEQPNNHYQRACCLARMGRAAHALKSLDKAIERGWTGAGHMAQNPDLESVRKDPKFQALLSTLRAKSTGRSFRSARDRAKGALDHTYMAVMLGYTGPRGNSVPEILGYLRAAAASDGTHPVGTVYLCKNKDLRSRTRQYSFAGTQGALRRMGRKVEILQEGQSGQTGILPVGKPDVIGAVIGRAGFDWPSSKSKILPGAIVENLTNFGCAFNTSGQTKVSELLRHGAAGSSGTVVEPRSLWWKFPHSYIHVYYAEGCSLAEAFYQSVAGPYQLLIVGDPLARPFAHFAKVRLGSPQLDQPWRADVELTAAITPAKDRPVGRVELWVDGKFITDGRADETLFWDTRAVDDGVHDLRLVAVEDSLIGTRSAFRAWVTVANGGAPQADWPAGATWLSAEEVQPEARPYGPEQIWELGTPPEGVTRVELVRGAQVLSTADAAGEWKLKIPTRQLGPGDVTGQLALRSVYPSHAVRSRPLAWRFEPAAPEAPPAAEESTAPLLPGFLAIVKAGGKDQRLSVPSLGNSRSGSLKAALDASVKGLVTAVTLRGEVHTSASGLHQLVVRAAGSVEIDLDCKPVLPKTPGQAQPILVSAALTAGWHALEIRYRPRGTPSLNVELGGAGVAATLGTTNVRHRRTDLVPTRYTPEVGPEQAVLFDGDRRKPGVDVSVEGVALVWKRSERKVNTIFLFPRPRTRRSRPWPQDWIVEYSTGRKRRPVKKLEVRVARRATRPGRNETPAWIEFSFKPLTTRKLWVRPKGPADPKAPGPVAALNEIEVYTEAPKRRR